MADNRCPGDGDHAGHHSYCVPCIEGVPEERPNEPTWLDLHVVDPETWVPDFMSRFTDD